MNVNQDTAGPGSRSRHQQPTGRHDRFTSSHDNWRLCGKCGKTLADHYSGRCDPDEDDEIAKIEKVASQMLDLSCQVSRTPIADGDVREAMAEFAEDILFHCRHAKEQQDDHKIS